MNIFDRNSPERLATVLFATDFSAASENAGHYAASLSRRFGARLVVAHGFYLDQAALEAETFRELASQQRTSLKRELDDVLRELASGEGAAESVLIEHDPRTAIAELARRRHPSLIVLGTHGGGAMERFVVGSTAEGILRHAREPALTVGPKVPPLVANSDALPLQIRRILLATNTTAGAAAVAELAVSLAGAFSATLDVLNVVHPKSVENTLEAPHNLYEKHEEAEAMLPAGAHNVAAEIRTFVSVGQPRTEILRHIQEREIELLVLGLSADSQLEMQGHLSGAFPIIAEAACPVLTMTSETASR